MKLIKKSLTAILLVCLVVLVTLGAGCTNSKSKGLTIDKTSLTMRVFESKTLTVETDSDSVTWSATNDSVTLVADGKTVTITGMYVGETTVIAKVDGSSVACKIVVFPTEDDIILTVNSENNVTLKVGQTYDIECAVTYQNAPFEMATISYELAVSTPLGAITVDENGKVTAVSQGMAIINVTASCGDMYSETKQITVSCFPEDYVNPSEPVLPDENGGIIRDVFDW